MQTYDLRFGDVLIQMPWWWLDGLLIWLGLMGLILFFFGRRMVRPMFAVVGLVGGALFGLAAAKTFFAEWPAVAFVIIGAVVGAALGFALFRLGMGLLLGTLLAVAAPVGLLIAQGQTGPAIEEPIVQTYHTVAEAIVETVQADADSNDAALKLKSLSEPLQEGADGVRAAASEWWGAMEVSARVTLVSLCGAAGILGLVLGLIFPSFGAAITTAMVGVLMMIGGIGRLTETHLSMDIMPGTARGMVVTVVAATIIGALIQWTIFRPRTDK
ncbi:hypothetical protein HED60_07630 [Planctomycetales bacterium ZRK34]|nr:hypothetical protein HED60_07630 [Planctomycetales bacterium ZRK34]